MLFCTGGLRGDLGVPIPIDYVLGRNKQLGPCHDNAEVFQMAFFLKNDLVSCCSCDALLPVEHWAQGFC